MLSFFKSMLDFECIFAVISHLNWANSNIFYLKCLVLTVQVLIMLHAYPILTFICLE